MILDSLFGWRLIDCQIIHRQSKYVLHLAKINIRVYIIKRVEYEYLFG